MPSALAADFLQPVTSPEPSRAGPGGVATGDVDNDGDQDIVETAAFSTTTSVLLNNGVGDFREILHASNAATVDVGLGKFDNDSNLDLVLLYPQTPPATGLLAVFKGNGNGTFTLQAGNSIANTGVRSTSIAIGNFNADAINDVAVVNSQNTPTTTPGTLTTYLGNPAGTTTFTSPNPVQTHTVQLGATDVVFDTFNPGAPDLVVSNATSQSTSFLAGNGVGFVAPVHSAAGSAVFYMASGNLNGDANTDIVATNQNSNPSSVRTLMGNNAGAFPTQATTVVSPAGEALPQQVIARDFDNDTDLDIAVANGFTVNTVSTANNSGAGVFTPAPTSPEPLTGVLPATQAIPFGLASADFDGSGFNDIAATVLVSNPPVTPILLNQSGNQADLSIVKTDGPDPVNAGDQLTYSLAVTNNSANAVTSAKTTDVLPAGVTFNAGASSPTCTAVGTAPAIRVTCDYGGIAGGATESQDIVVNVLTTEPIPASLSNTATVAGNLADPTPANNTSTTTTAVTPRADVSMTKTDTGSDPVDVGEDITYTLTAANGGPNTALNVTATDPLPPGTTFNAGASDPLCGESGGTVTCTFGTLANGANASRNVVLTTDGAAVPSVSNTATVDTDSFDPNNTNDSDTETTTVNPVVDLSIDKTDDADPIHVGEQVTYTLDVANGGPNAANNVTVTDTLPAELTFNDPDSDPRCDEISPGEVECDLGTIANGGTDSVEIVATGNAPAAAASDSAEVASDEVDSDSSDNTDAETTEILAAADLSIDKQDSPDPVNAGSDITYVLEVTNNGPSTATDVHATDTLPTGLTFESTPDSCTAVGQDVDCDIGVLLSGNTETATFVVSTDASAAPEVDNTATVDGAEDDLVPGNDSDTETTTVNAAAGLSIAKSDDVDPVHVGDDITYTLDVANAGPSTANNVLVTDTLPAEVTYDDAASDSRCDETTPGTVECTTTSIANAASDSWDVVVSADSATPAATDSATVESDEADPSPADNTASEDTEILAAADLVLDKFDTVDPVHVGEDVTYGVALGNFGPSDATNVTITDTLPAEVTYDDAASDPRCDETAPGIVECAIGALAAGGGDGVLIVAEANAPAAPATNAATVDADEDDLDLANNSDTETTTILAAADLAIDKTDDADPVNVGDDITYTLEATNNGPSAANNVTVTDSLPAEVAYDDGASDPACDETSPGTVECDLGTLASGASDSVEVVVSADAPAAAASDTATVSADEDDLVPGNDSDTETTEIRALADLSIDKADAGSDPVEVGGNITYTFDVTNNGPSTATDIHVTDTLPAGLTFESTSDSCTAVGQDVDCDIGVLLSGNTETATIVVSAGGAASPSVDNTAEVAGAEDDPNTGNNSDTETTTVNPAADLSISKDDAGSDPVDVGDDIVYTLSVTNSGPSGATAVEATDTLPAGLTFNPAGSDAACTEVGGVVTCDYGAVASGDTEDLTLAATTDAAATPSVDNTAEVAGAEVDPDPGDNSDTETTTVNGTADLTIDKTATNGPVNAGEFVVYEIEVTNNGPTNAADVISSDALPAGTTFRAAGSSPDCSESGGTVTCEFGVVDNGTSETRTLILQTSAVNAPSFDNTAVVSSSTNDPNPGNDDDTETVQVNPAADLALTKLDAIDPVTVGDQISYALTVQNLGPSDATNVIVTDPLPAGLSFAFEGPFSDCTPSGVPNVTVRCDFGNLAFGDIATQSFTATTSTAGTVSNTAVVDGDETDPALANNTDGETTLVNPLVVPPPVVPVVPVTPVTPPAAVPDKTAAARKKCKKKKSRKARKRCLRKLKKNSA